MNRTMSPESEVSRFRAGGPLEFGRAIAERRRAQGVTQSELAGTIGVDRRVIGQLERGKPTVQLVIAIDAARAVGLDISLVPR